MFVFNTNFCKLMSCEPTGNYQSQKQRHLRYLTKQKTDLLLSDSSLSLSLTLQQDAIIDDMLVKKKRHYIKKCQGKKYRKNRILI